MVLLASACGGGDSKAAAPVGPLPTLLGYVALRGPEFLSGGPGECSGVGPYRTMQTGLAVTLLDHQGRPVSAGVLEPGTGSNILNGQLSECLFKFQLVAVPRSSTYTLKIGDVLSQPYLYGALAFVQWQVVLPLGHLGQPKPPPSQPIPLL